jgi:hypothetical protein
MSKFNRRNGLRMLQTGAVGVAIFGLVQLSATSGQAQLLDQLKGATGSGKSDSGGVLGNLGGGGGLPSVGQASESNTAGVLQYGVRNNYVGGGASSVKDSLMSKLTGSGQGTNDSGYKAGSNGMLDTGNGQSYSLGGGGIKQQVTQKVCDLILQHAKSFL